MISIYIITKLLISIIILVILKGTILIVLRRVILMVMTLMIVIVLSIVIKMDIIIGTCKHQIIIVTSIVGNSENISTINIDYTNHQNVPSITYYNRNYNNDYRRNYNSDHRNYNDSAYNSDSSGAFYSDYDSYYRDYTDSSPSITETSDYNRDSNSNIGQGLFWGL